MPRLVRMHADEMEDIDERQRRRHRARCSASTAPRATRSPTASVNYTHDARCTCRIRSSRCAVTPKDKRDAGQLLQGAQPLRQGGPDLPRAPRRGVGRDHHQRHGRAAPRHLHRAHEARVQRARSSPASRRSPTARPSPSEAEFSYTHKKQTGGSGQYGKVAGYIEPLPAEHPAGTTSSSTTSSAASSRASSSPRCDKGFREAIKKGPLIGFPVVGVQCDHQRRRLPPVDSSRHRVPTAALHGASARPRARPSRPSSSRS